MHGSKTTFKGGNWRTDGTVRARIFYEELVEKSAMARSLSRERTAERTRLARFTLTREWP